MPIYDFIILYRTTKLLTTWEIKERKIGKYRTKLDGPLR